MTEEGGISNIAVVVSAMGGKPKVTDLLLDSVDAASNRNDSMVNDKLGFILEKHFNCLDALPIDPEKAQILKEKIENDIGQIRDILKTVALMKWKAERISELVSGYGETWSAQILSALLSARSADRQRAASASATMNESGTIAHYWRYLDARRVITVDEDAIKDGAVCWDISSEKLNQMNKEEQDTIFKNLSDEEVDRSMIHFVITGYVASNTHGVATTLQRDGSDYSAAIMGRLLKSTNITIWTDVDGVLSADPRRVPDSYVLPEVSFNEAMELAYFGAKVIHPKTVSYIASSCKRQLKINYPGCIIILTLLSIVETTKICRCNLQLWATHKYLFTSETHSTVLFEDQEFSHRARRIPIESAVSVVSVRLKIWQLLMLKVVVWLV